MRITGLNEYQKLANQTALPSALSLAYLAPGIAAEAGEVAGKWAKVVRDDNGELSEEKRKELLKEVGDTLWFAALICEVLHISLQEVAERNIYKLQDRKERGVIGGSGDDR